jgi:hypothetical protein
VQPHRGVEVVTESDVGEVGKTHQLDELVVKDDSLRLYFFKPLFASGYTLNKPINYCRY